MISTHLAATSDPDNPPPETPLSAKDAVVGEGEGETMNEDIKGLKVLEIGGGDCRLEGAVQMDCNPECAGLNMYREWG
jgi:hypothetical protein